MLRAQDFVNSAEATGTWSLVPDGSTVTFENKTMWGLATVKGRFTRFTGHAEVTDAGDVSGEVDIDADSLDTGVRMRDRHLRSDDFLKVTRYPRISVVVTSAEAGNTDSVGLEAYLTVTGTTRPLPLEATVRRRDDDSVMVSTGQTVDHTTLGLLWNKFRAISKNTAVHADLLFERVQAPN
ncbi:YceI family protein [Mycolicibacterium moriokaense]|nr:YceI family protein [Mycolicibacterium moriokaense]